MTTDRLCEMCGQDKFYGHVCIPCRMTQFHQVAIDIRDAVERADVHGVWAVDMLELADRIDMLVGISTVRTST